MLEDLKHDLFFEVCFTTAMLSSRRKPPASGSRRDWWKPCPRHRNGRFGHGGYRWYYEDFVFLEVKERGSVCTLLSFVMDEFFPIEFIREVQIVLGNECWWHLHLNKIFSWTFDRRWGLFDVSSDGMLIQRNSLCDFWICRSSRKVRRRGNGAKIKDRSFWRVLSMAIL